MEKPIHISERLELFVDRFLINTMDKIEFQLHEPQRLALPKTPFRGAYMTVIKDGDIYRGYYRGDDPAYPGPRNYSGHPGEITCYAESRNGHEWTFPSIGLFDVNGTRSNNVILAKQPPLSHNFSPFLDTRPGVDQNERFKALAGHPGFDRKKLDGLHSFASPDGIHWKKTSNEPVIPYQQSWSHAFDSQNVSFWSESEQLYIAYFRTWTHYRANPGESPELHRESGWGLRSISRVTSHDFKNWSDPVAMHPNMQDEHLYTSQTHPYYRAPHIYVALPSRYVAGRVGAETRDAMQGSTDILFMASRAGTTHYERLFTEAFIRPGLDPERWVSRGNYVALNVVPTSETEMSIYHSSGHRYTLRIDGFVSLHAGAAFGEVVTKPLIFSGNKLIVNYSTSAAGSLRVELQDTTGTPVPGFSLADCPVIVGDTITQHVKWQNNPCLSSLAGKPIRLRFEMREGDLYSFCFRSK